ncbi:hypothetical protein FB451DRAFT_1190595 [Mycena latifolia]|nr:hypothetical protein FB451DRAFT_1190595 [Mycena latifolia]
MSRGLRMNSLSPRTSIRVWGKLCTNYGFGPTIINTFFLCHISALAAGPILSGFLAYVLMPLLPQASFPRSSSSSRLLYDHQILAFTSLWMTFAFNPCPALSGALPHRICVSKEDASHRSLDTDSEKEPHPSQPSGDPSDDDGSVKASPMSPTMMLAAPATATKSTLCTCHDSKALSSSVLSSMMATANPTATTMFEGGGKGGTSTVMNPIWSVVEFRVQAHKTYKYGEVFNQTTQQPTCHPLPSHPPSLGPFGLRLPLPPPPDGLKCPRLLRLSVTAAPTSTMVGTTRDPRPTPAPTPPPLRPSPLTARSTSVMRRVSYGSRAPLTQCHRSHARHCDTDTSAAIAPLPTRPAASRIDAPTRVVRTPPEATPPQRARSGACLITTVPCFGSLVTSSAELSVNGHSFRAFTNNGGFSIFTEFQPPMKGFRGLKALNIFRHFKSNTAHDYAVNAFLKYGKQELDFELTRQNLKLSSNGVPHFAGHLNWLSIYTVRLALFLRLRPDTSIIALIDSMLLRTKPSNTETMIVCIAERYYPLLFLYARAACSNTDPQFAPTWVESRHQDLGHVTAIRLASNHHHDTSKQLGQLTSECPRMQADPVKGWNPSIMFLESIYARKAPKFPTSSIPSNYHARCRRLVLVPLRRSNDPLSPNPLLGTQPLFSGLPEVMHIMHDDYSKLFLLSFKLSIQGASFGGLHWSFFICPLRYSATDSGRSKRVPAPFFAFMAAASKNAIFRETIVLVNQNYRPTPPRDLDLLLKAIFLGDLNESPAWRAALPPDSWVRSSGTFSDTHQMLLDAHQMPVLERAGSEGRRWVARPLMQGLTGTRSASPLRAAVQLPSQDELYRSMAIEGDPRNESESFSPLSAALQLTGIIDLTGTSGTSALPAFAPFHAGYSTSYSTAFGGYSRNARLLFPAGRTAHTYVFKPHENLRNPLEARGDLARHPEGSSATLRTALMARHDFTARPRLVRLTHSASQTYQGLVRRIARVLWVNAAARRGSERTEPLARGLGGAQIARAASDAGRGLDAEPSDGGTRAREGRDHESQQSCWWNEAESSRSQRHRHCNWRGYIQLYNTFDHDMDHIVQRA